MTRYDSPMLEMLSKTAQEMREAYRMNPDPGPQEEKKYRWVPVAGTFKFRAHCIPCDQLMGWAMEIRPEYGETINKHTGTNWNRKHQVIYKGKPVQVWKCGGCKQTVVK